MALQLHNLRLSHIDIKIAISFLTVITVSGLMFQLKAKELSDDPSFKAFYGWYEKWKPHHLVSMQTKTIPGTMIACGWDNHAFQAPIKPNTGIQWERTGISENLQSEKAELHHRSCCCCQSGLKALAQMHQMSPLGATNFIKVHNIQKLLLLCCITSASLITWLQARGVILISYHYFILF